MKERNEIDKINSVRQMMSNQGSGFGFYLRGILNPDFQTGSDLIWKAETGSDPNMKTETGSDLIMKTGTEKKHPNPQPWEQLLAK